MLAIAPLAIAHLLDRHRAEAGHALLYRRYVTVASNHFFTDRDLPGSQEGFDQLAIAADNRLRKSFEPSTLWNFWLGDEPVSELTELIGRNFALCDSIEQMIQQCRRKILSRPTPADARPLPRGFTGHVAVPNGSILPPDLRHFVADRRSRG